nr:hypothetical protein Itr_chr02CG09710 [Ipomoea trifida]GMC57826.1 hypothetical protein Iba_chr02aCG9360 [Ipomoea batatas]GMC60326.1 hypothetical protein Iba_chr02bCG9770 [Ipomoea batatas]
MELSHPSDGEHANALAFLGRVFAEEDSNRNQN